MFGFEWLKVTTFELLLYVLRWLVVAILQDTFDVMILWSFIDDSKEAEDNNVLLTQLFQCMFSHDFSVYRKCGLFMYLRLTSFNLYNIITTAFFFNLSFFKLWLGNQILKLSIYLF